MRSKAFSLGVYQISSSAKHAQETKEMSHTNRLQDLKRDESISEISSSISGKLDRVSVALPESLIFRVHHQLRAVNERAYEPVILSVGPYHHGKSNLRQMEEHKLRYLNELIKRREAVGIPRSHQLETYLRALKDLEDQARGYYDEAILIEPGKFLQMMLLDGCFIIQLFRKFSADHNEPDPFLKGDWIHNALRRDLTLLENQLPFPILKTLHHVISDEPGQLHLISDALNYLPTYSHLPTFQNDHEIRIYQQSISDLAKRPLPVPISSASCKSRRLNPEKLNDIKHLLDLVRKFMLVEETLEFRSQKKGEHQVKKVVSREGINKRRNKFKYSAVELRDSGVTFKRMERRAFYDIRFEKGILEIPVIRITDNTEALFRNLIAYEEHARGDEVKYIISNYMAFMDGLINCSKDVELLRRRGIIVNLMGDDEAVTEMFAKINKNTVIKTEFYQEETISRLTEHCEKQLNVWMAKLKRNYLNCPWALLSIVVGVLLILMDVAQTAYAYLSYRKIKNSEEGRQ